jgi:hypothetical protein
MKKRTKGIIILILLIAILTASVGTAVILFNNNSKVYSKNETKGENINPDIPEEAITKDVTISITSTINNETSYGFYFKNSNDEFIGVTFLASDFDLPSNLDDYSSDIYLRVTYSEKDLTVYACKVINRKNGEIIKDLSENNLRKLFDIEYNKNIIEKDWTDKISLSQLTEKEIYKYMVTETSQMPEIINDTGENCLIYIKENKVSEFYKSEYEKEIKMYEEVSSSSVSLSFHQIENSINIMYEKIDNDSLLKLILDDDLIKLSDYNNGDELSYSFEKYIYNNTEYDITLKINDSFFRCRLNKFYGIKSWKNIWI